MPLKPSPVENDEDIELEDEDGEWKPSPEVEERKGISKRLLPPADIGQKEALKLVGQLLDERHYTLLLDETGTVGTPEGGPICTLLKNRIPKDLLDRVRPVIRAAASQQVAGGNRVAAAGAGAGLRLRADGSMSKISGVPGLLELEDEDYWRLEPARDGTVGYNADTTRAGQKYPCRQSAFTAKAPVSQFSAMCELAATVGEAWRKSILWIQHSIQMEKAEVTHRDYIIETSKGITPFTTVTCNKSWRTAAHIDSGDLKQGFGAMCCLGDFEGCDLVFPRYKLAVRFREGDILLADVANQVHGNTPLLNPDGSIPKPGEVPERLVCVFYYQERMEHCRIPEEEMKVINTWKKGQSTRKKNKKKKKKKS
jgi:hypothetical protein